MVTCTRTSQAEGRSQTRGWPRVALVGPSSRNLLGGQEVQLDQLASAWSADSAVALCVVRYQPNLPTFLRTVENIPLLRTIVRSPFYLTSLFKATKEAEIVHAFSGSHSSFLIATLPALLVARLRGKNTVVHYHSCKALQHLTASAISRALLSRTNCIIVVPSAYLARVFGQFGLRASIVPNTIALDAFPFRPRKPVRPLLLCTRNFYDCCGVDIVIRAFSEVKRAFPKASLSLVGGGTQEQALRRLVQELQVEGVQFAGRVERDKIASVYAGNDIFINGSVDDNAPVSILEASASGLPVVTSDAGGVLYLVQHEVTGLLSKVGDWKALANNVLRVLQDERLAEKLSRNAYKAVQQHSWEAVRTRWLEVYTSLGN